MILGTVGFHFGGGRHQATLDSALHWTSTNPLTALVLNREYRHYAPADGQPGARLLADAAAWLDGEATWMGPA